MFAKNITCSRNDILETLKKISEVYKNGFHDRKPEILCPACDHPIKYALDLITLNVAFVCPGCGLSYFQQKM